MILNINKPPGITSHDVVDRVRSITGERRVGHAGTLDPFATGVLLVAVGRDDTKKLGQLAKDTQKEYEAVMELGKTSTTGDPEGDIQLTISNKQLANIEKVDVQRVLKKFQGEIVQIPPVFSAVKVKGTPSYKLARKGKAVELPARRVTMYNIEILDFDYPSLKLKVTCSAGTYIRTLAQDIGKELGVGAYLKELTRTRVGEFALTDSIVLEQLS